MEKKYCTIHHLWYKGNECPMCCSERVAKLEKKFMQKRKKTVADKEITQASIEALIAKFNNK